MVNTNSSIINPNEVIESYFQNPLLMWRMKLGYETVSKFFIPNQKFIQWCKEAYPDSHFIDCGCGLGHVTKELRKAGLKVHGIDLYPTSYAVIDDIMPMDSVMFTYVEGMVPLLCRPCRGDWIHATIVRAVEACGVFLYVGKESHYSTDLLPLPYKVDRIMEDVGEAGEVMWRIAL